MILYSSLVALFLVINFHQQHAILTSSDYFPEVAKSQFFRDKTPFLKSFFAAKSPIYMTMPKGFGKSTLLSMVNEYVRTRVHPNGTIMSRFNSDSAILFRKMIINKFQSLASRSLGRYPVIYFRFKRVSVGSSFLHFQKSFHELLVAVTQEHQHLTISRVFSDADKAGIEDLMNGKIENAFEHVEKLAGYLNLHFRQKCIILIDDVDWPVSQILDEQYPAEEAAQIMSFLKTFLTSLIRLDKSVAKHLFAGNICFLPDDPLLDVARFGNGRPISRFFGFIAFDVGSLCNKYRKYGGDFATVWSWYGGYKQPERGLGQFNLLSVLNYIETGQYSEYWQDSIYVEKLKVMFHPKITGDKIEDLLSTSKIELSDDKSILNTESLTALKKELQEYRKTNKTSVVIHKDVLIAILVEQGYLFAPISTPKLVGTFAIGTIPNKEAFIKLDRTVYNQFFYDSKFENTHKPLEKFVNSTLRLREDESDYKIVGETIESLFALTDYKEVVSFARMLALFADVSNNFDFVHRRVSVDNNKELNLILITKKRNLGIIFRFNLGEKSSHEILSHLVKEQYYNIFTKDLQLFSVTETTLIAVHFNDKRKCDLSYLYDSVNVDHIKNVTWTVSIDKI